MKRRVRVVSAYIDALSMDETMRRVTDIVNAGKPTQHVAVNAAKLVRMHEDRLLRDVIQKAPLVNADGQAVVWAARLLGRPLPERVTGIDLMDRIFDQAAQVGWRVYLLGAEATVVEEAVRRALRRGVPVAGYRDGYWKSDEERTVIEAVAASNADVLLVALPTPKKEFWLSENLDDLNVAFCMGVGGSFDILAGKTRRAPKLVQQIGCEWLYRLCQEPRRMFGRYARTNIKFCWLLAQELWQSRARGA